MTRDITSLDFSTINALQQKRTLAFVNHFILTTVQFLNNFAKTCEHKLMQFERKLEKVEAAMVLLEARLSSIPEVNTINEKEKSDEIEPLNEEPSKEAKEEPYEPPDLPTQSYPEYEKFVKMVQVGVPLPAVKLKLSTEGLDPNVLDQILQK